MRRGTTPINTFQTDMDLSEASAIYITYKQKHFTFEKTLPDITFTESGGVQVQLTQDETLRLDPSERVYIQIRAVLPDGNRVASNIISAGVKDVLKDGEI